MRCKEIVSQVWVIDVAVLTIGCRRFDHRLSPFWPKISVLTNDCRRFDQWLSPFWLIVVAVLTYALSPFWPQLSPFLLSPFWRVAVFVVVVPTCRRYDLYPYQALPPLSRDLLHERKISQAFLLTSFVLHGITWSTSRIRNVLHAVKVLHEIAQSNTANHDNKNTPAVDINVMPLWKYKYTWFIKYTQYTHI